MRPIFDFLRISSSVSAMLLCAFGCSSTHLHDDHSAQLSTSIAAALESYRKPTTSIYDTMVANHQKTESALSQHEAQLATLRTTAFLNQLNTHSWADIDADLTRVQGLRASLNTVHLGKLQDILKKRGIAATEIDTENKALTKANALVTQASQQQLQYKARQLLLQGAIKVLAEQNKVDKSTYDSLRTQVLNEQIPGETQNGKPVTIADALAGDLKSLNQLDFSTILTQYTFGQFDPKKAPGIGITILSLGADLANASLQRTTVERDYLDAQTTLLQASFQDSTEIATARQRIKEREADTRAGLQFDPSKTPLQTITDLQKPLANKDDPSGRADAIKAVLQITAAYAVNETIDDPNINDLVLQARLASTEHDYSIRISAVDAAEQEALVGRGLQALVAYHAGGITPEQIANLIRAAQTAALSVVAYGVQ